MGKRASYYLRYGDLICSATSSLDSPDALDDLRRQVERGFAFSYATVEFDDDETADEPDATITENLPPVE
jgi:hypothetical protein